MIARKIGKWVLILLGIILLAAVALVLWLTVREYKPAAVEDISAETAGLGRSVSVGDTVKILSLNTGYAGLGREADFFMDGGKSVQPTEAQSSANLSGIGDFLCGQDADVYLLQEVDSGSRRSYGVDQTRQYRDRLSADGDDVFASAYALNYSCDFVPYRLPPIGKVHSGVQTISRLELESAQRIALPCPFSWPVSAANLKRCLLVSYVPLAGTDRQLVLVNLHLEAYDDGEGKAAQTQVLMELLTAEYEKGNYVIAGGDFNQVFPGTTDTYPIKNPDLWAPGVLEAEMLPAGWQFAFDDSVPTCRLLNQPYVPDSPDTQFYVIDGFIVSPNVTVESVTTLDEQFTRTDHNPVSLTVTLAEE